MGIRAIALAVLAVAPALAGPALAGPPGVATDIPPVHSLVARIMEGVGEPALILPPGGSPHGHAMRPSEAAALAGADVVIWTGGALTPWLGRAIATLADDAVSLELLEVEGTRLLGYRPEASRHGDAGAGEPEAGHPIPEGAVDPHAWLDPENARIWSGAIAAALAEADPGNADIYARNAAGAAAELDALIPELAATLVPLREKPFIVFHDAYGYFEHRFDIASAGAIALGDAAPPSPARMAAIRETVRRLGVRCVFAEPQFAGALIDTVIEGTEARVAILDPLGASLPAGAALYPQLMRALAASLRDCLGPGT